MRSFVPNEKKSACSAISSARTHARGSSIIVPTQVLELALLVCCRDRQRPQPPQLLAEADERVHDLDERRVAGALLHGDRRAHDRAHLHLVDLRAHQPEPAAARAEHRVRLAQRADPLAHLLVGRLLERRQELVQRRVEQADRHRQARHRLEDALEVRLLEREQPVERAAPLVLARGHDHLADDREPVLGHEHVLGAAEADALGAELARLGRVLGRVRVRAHLQAPHVVGPAEDRLEVLVDLRRDERRPRRASRGRCRRRS